MSWMVQGSGSQDMREGKCKAESREREEAEKKDRRRREKGEKRSSGEGRW